MDLPIPETPADPVAQARHDRSRFFGALLLSLCFVALLWWIKMLEVWLGQSLSGLGVRPGSVPGLIGLVAAPLLHGSFGHLLNNTLPLLVLGTLTLALYPRAATRAIALIWLGSGLGIWLFGRDSVHLGASGLNHGLMFLLFTLGLLRRDRAGIAALMIAFLLYGGMLLTVFPGDPQISWEAHLFGAMSGVAAALLWRARDPLPARKKYSWELEDESIRALEDTLAAEERDLYEPPAPRDVPVLWQRPDPAPRGVVVPFRPRRDGDATD
ncbi:rhomboid family intramembrane serine protease [Chiayiivirga flava]|uniref:Membrane associated rhomboid family serine protease n=1 Tax=Chiayiivirga flava TaxID=659595 RepID=A0A7W8G067_9GAMM|nr:rhomboid family intramembrane serine protease [Chiayiivirga flava]MBB5207939.1 membrane associated rhomboid family serine protease [Chiayiivirga flava]